MIIFMFFGIIVAISIILGEVKYRIEKKFNSNWKVIFNKEMSKKLK